MPSRATKALAVTIAAPLIVGIAVFAGIRLARVVERAEQGERGDELEQVQTEEGQLALQEPLQHGFAEEIDPPERAAEFTLQDQSGETITFSEDAGDGVVVLGFWLTRCTHGCPINAYTVARLQQLLEDRQPEIASDVTYLAVSIDPEHDTLAERREFVDEYLAEYGGAVRFLGGDREELEPVWDDYAVYVETRSTAAELERLEMTEQQLLQQTEQEMHGGHHAAVPEAVRQGVIEAVERAVADDHLVVHNDVIYLIKDGQLRYRLLGHDIDAEIVAEKIARLAGG